MTQRLALFVFALTASACTASKGPPPRVAEVPIDEGSPRTGGITPSSAGPELTADPASAFGGGAAGGGAAGGGAAGGGAGGAGAGAAGGAARAGGAGTEGFPVQLPSLLPQMTEVPTAAGGAVATNGSSPRPPPSKAERLSPAECNKIMDKYIELVGISQGISPDAISGVMTMLRNSVANDANYTNALGACAKENTKTQYRCAMKAKDVDGWKKCLE
jgi:hypothetical protein